MKIRRLGVTGSMVFVANYEKAVAWDIPARDSALSFRANTDGSVHATAFDDSARPPIPPEPSFLPCTSISPNLNYVAIIEGNDDPPDRHLDIYDTWTGKHLTRTIAVTISIPYFTPDGREIWCVGALGPVAGWTIIEESKSRLIKLEPLEPSTQPWGVSPWESPCGYEVADSGWVLSPTKKRLLWLPRYLLPYPKDRVWQGRFFGFLHGEPPETVILEFLE